MIKNIIFDCSDTLLHLGAIDYLIRLTGDKERAEQIHKRLFFSKIWWEYDRGGMDEMKARDALVALLSPEDREIGRLYFDNWFLQYTPIEGIPELIKELKEKGYRLYVLSDFPTRFDVLWNQFDFFRYFDGRVVSYEIGYKKFELKPFEILLEKYGLKREECLFTDDGEICITSAKACGIPAHQFVGVADLRRVLGL